MNALSEPRGARHLRIAQPVPLPNGRVSVSIVSWNTRELTRNCLRALFASSIAAELEVVVVDNGSTDGTADMIEGSFPEVHVIRNVCNEGFARANNQAVQASTAPYVLLLNSDTEVSREAVERCRAFLLQHRDVGAVGCRIIDPHGELQSSVFRYPSFRGALSTSLWLVNAFPRSTVLNHDRYGCAHPSDVADVEVVMGSFLMVRRSDVADQLFDEGFFMYAEEADLCRRLRDRGLRVTFLPDATVVHVAGASTRTARQVAWSHEAKKRAQLRFIWKWDGPTVAYLTNVVMLLGMVPRSVAWLLGDVGAMGRGRKPRNGHKVAALIFHVRCLLQPSYMTRRQSGPPDG